MDGVLVDSGEFHYQSWVGTFAGFGTYFSRETFRKTFGMNNRTSLTIVYDRPPSEEFLAEVTDLKEGWFRRAIKGQLQPLPGVMDWITQLKDMGFRQAVASSAPMENVIAVMRELNLDNVFDGMISGYDIPGKPDPGIFLKAAKMVGIPPVNCVVIEDSIAGVQAARNAGMPCIAVLTTNPAEAVQTADIITPDLSHLPVNTVRQLLKI